MSIDEKAEAACNEWCAWIRAEGDGFWKWGNIPDEAIAEWIPGYLRGVHDTITAAHSDHDPAPDYEWLWNFGEDLSLFKQRFPPNEMVAKCHAAGYVAGYNSIGGGNG